VRKGGDGIVFVVDSQTPMLDACKESYQNLEENLRELGLVLADIPKVFQWNKRDLRNVVPVEELEAVFNRQGTSSFQSVASDGTGVFETLRGITKVSLFHIKTHVLGEGQPEPAPVAPAAPAVPDQAITALTLSDLPSVTDLLDMEGSSSLPSPQGAAPLPDEDDDSGFFIEAPLLPEPPEVAQEEIAFLMVERTPPSAVQVEAEESPEPVAVEPEPLVVPEPAAEVSSAAPVPVEPLFPASMSARLTPDPAPPKPTVARHDPLAALASLKLEAKRPSPKAKSIDHKDAINSLLGELTQAGRFGSPSVLRLEVPADLEGHEFEVVVQLRHQGQVLVEGQVTRPAPGKGSTAKLSVEMKRS